MSSPRRARPTPLTVAVAHDGEWIRRRVGAPSMARGLAVELGVPVYDAAIVAYPEAMRRYRRPDDRPA